MTSSRILSITSCSVAALFLAAAGCATQRVPPPPDSVQASATGPAVTADSMQVMVDRSAYRPGDNLTLRIVNRTSLTLGYNACTRALEVNRDGTWATISDSTRMCTMELALISPGASQSATTSLQSPLSPGEYRVVLHFSPQNESVSSGTTRGIEATSNAFRIQ